MARSVNTSYDGGGTVRTSMSREPMDLGPAPDFFGDLEKVKKLFSIKAPAQEQAQALRMPAYSSGPMMESGGSAQPRVDPPDYSNWSPRSFGHPSMSPQGVLGHYVNPLDVPLGLQGSVPTGFFTDNASSNYTYSPTVNPARYALGSTQREKPR